MMLFTTGFAALATLLCPLTLPIWVFVIVGFHCVGRKELQRRYLRRHGKPVLFSRDWWVLNV